MVIQKVTRRVLLGLLGLSLSALVGCATLYSAPMRGAAACPGCDRVVLTQQAR